MTSAIAAINGTTGHACDEGIDQLYAWFVPPVAPARLPEAPVSVNCHIIVAGRQVQVTLRGTSEVDVLRRLETILQQYPILPPLKAQNPRSPAGETTDTSQPGWCQIHNVQMQENTKNGRTWLSHRTAEGWCKGKGVRHE
jgi:hypothetical protein